MDPYRGSDAAEVAALLSRVPELPDTTEDAFRAFAALGFNRGARDFRVVREGGRVVALLTSTRLDGAGAPIRHFRIAVHPSARRRGIGRRLLAEVERDAHAERSTLQCNSQSSWTAANAFLEQAGLAVAERELLMRAVLPLPALVAPAGIELRLATAADDAAWSELHAIGYGERDDFVPLDADAERARPGFALVIAEEGERAAGIAHGLHHEGDEALLHSVVVRPEQRGRGIAAALVSAVSHELRRKGCTAISLNVEAENAGAIALYRRLGFATYDEMLTYRRAP